MKTARCYARGPGNTALHIAADYNSRTCYNLLIAHGADDKCGNYFGLTPKTLMMRWASIDDMDDLGLDD